MRITKNTLYNIQPQKVCWFVVSLMLGFLPTCHAENPIERNLLANLDDIFSNVCPHCQSEAPSEHVVSKTPEDKPKCHEEPECVDSKFPWYWSADKDVNLPGQCQTAGTGPVVGWVPLGTAISKMGCDIRELQGSVGKLKDFLGSLGTLPKKIPILESKLSVLQGEAANLRISQATLEDNLVTHKAEIRRGFSDLEEKFRKLIPALDSKLNENKRTVLRMLSEQIQSVSDVQNSRLGGLDDRLSKEILDLKYALGISANYPDDENYIERVQKSVVTLQDRVEAAEHDIGNVADPQLRQMLKETCGTKVQVAAQNVCGNLLAIAEEIHEMKTKLDGHVYELIDEKVQSLRERLQQSVADIKEVNDAIRRLEEVVGNVTNEDLQSLFQITGNIHSDMTDYINESFTSSEFNMRLSTAIQAVSDVLISQKVAPLSTSLSGLQGQVEEIARNVSDNLQQQEESAVAINQKVGSLSSDLTDLWGQLGIISKSVSNNLLRQEESAGAINQKVGSISSDLTDLHGQLGIISKSVSNNLLRQEESDAAINQKVGSLSTSLSGLQGQAEEIARNVSNNLQQQEEVDAEFRQKIDSILGDLDNFQRQSGVDRQGINDTLQQMQQQEESSIEGIRQETHGIQDKLLQLEEQYTTGMAEVQDDRVKNEEMFGELATALEALVNWKDRISQNVTNTASTVTQLQSELSSVRSEISNMRTEINNELNNIKDEIIKINKELEIPSFALTSSKG
ncbi:MAG: hypothetical protein LBF72_03385 [Holosporales bacterium]|jgi:chromosome segregation ATPase|nr:hypothetical protein [Holosporales bacterium]